MALENVIEEIISQSEKQKMEIIEQGKQEAWKIIEEATNKAKQRTQSYHEETAKILDENKKMEVSSSNIRLHKLALEAKRNVLEELYSSLIERINGMSAPERKEILHKLIGEAKKDVKDAKYVYCSSKDRQLLADAGVQIKGTIDCLGGVVVESADGSMRANYTFDVLLQNIKEVHLNEIAKRIF